MLSDDDLDKFPRVALGDAEPQHLIVVPNGELRAAFEALIQDCLRAQAG